MEETINLLHSALANRMLTNKEHAKCISTAVGRYGTACTGDTDLVELFHRLDLLNALLNDIGVAAGMGDENAAGVDVRGVSNAIGDILLECHAELAAVLFANNHFSLLYHDTRLKLQQIGTKRGNCRATTALM